MTSAFTANKSIEQPANGDYDNTWNVPVNGDWAIIDKAFGSSVTKTFSNTDITLTISEAQNQQIVCQGTLTANVHLIIPFQLGSSTTAVGGEWVVYNNTSGAFSLIVITQVGGSSGVSIVQGFRAKVYSNTANIAYSDDPRIFPGQGLTLNSGVMNLIAPVAVAYGGTGQTTYTDGQLLIGNSLTGGLTKATLTSGANITIVNQNGQITISATGSGTGVGTVTSVGMSGGSTGLTFTSSNGNPINSNGTFTLSGILGISSGGTGGASFSGYLKGNGTSPFTGVTQIPGADITGDITGKASSITGTIPVGQVSGLGSMASQNSSSVAISGGTINNVTFGALTCSGLTATSTNITAPTFSTTGSGEYGFGGGTGLVGGSGTCGLYASGSLIAGASSGAFQLGSGITPYNFVSANWTVLSDVRLKQNVQNYANGLAAVISLRPVTFQYNGVNNTPVGTTQVGLIAQEVQDTALSNMVKDQPHSGYLTLDTNDLTYALINAVKELNARVLALEAQVAALSH